MYLTILVALRLFRREVGALSTADLLVVVLVADAAQNAMASEYHSITEGVVLIATIFAWNYLLDWLGYRYPRVHRLLHSPPLLLVKHGHIQRRNLRAEMLTVSDLKEQLRQQGIEDLTQVKKCWLEADGHLSVIKKDRATEQSPSRKRTVS
ncbi:MAG TPA: YetF domain-containing protein [Gemmatimonadales bacterium]